jgi:hypothetical protein
MGNSEYYIADGEVFGIFDSFSVTEDEYEYGDLINQLLWSGDEYLASCELQF